MPAIASIEGECAELRMVALGKALPLPALKPLD
jgi:hypothetical protein